MHWLMQVKDAATGQPMYRPFMILFLVLLGAIVGAVAYYLFKQSAGDPTHPNESSDTEKFKELVRAILTATLTAGFLILTFEDKIDAGIYANTFAVILAFWFGQKMSETKQQPTQNGSTPPAHAPAAESAKVP